MDATVGRESIQAVEEEASLISTVKQAGEIYLYFSQRAFSFYVRTPAFPPG